jgi:RNA polymerase sigma-70 factor (ECF subfamily)
MLKYRETFDDGSHFKGWMYRIARNARADHFKRIQADADHAALEMRASHRDVSSFRASPDDERARLLRQALAELPEPKRELLVLARYQGMTHEEIAALLNVEAGTVKVRVHRAMKELTEILERLLSESEPCAVKKPETILRTI